MALTLPTKKRKPIAEINRSSFLLHGAPKIGKSTFCSQIDGAVFLATEAGLNFLEVAEVSITSWEELLEAYLLLKKGNHGFTTVVIDTLNNAYRFCAEYICRKYNIVNIADLPDKKGHTICNNEFYRVMSLFSQLPLGLYLIAHSKIVEIKTPTGKISKWTLAIPGGPADAIIGLVDLTAYCQIAEGKDANGNQVKVPAMYTRGTPYYEAGGRIKDMPAILPLDYKAFEAAFYNRPDALRANLQHPKELEAHGTIEETTQA